MTGMGTAPMGPVGRPRHAGRRLGRLVTAGSLRGARPLLTATVAVAAALLSACGEEDAAVPTPAPVAAEQACALDGMLLAYHDGPKAQVLRRDGERAFYCDAKEVFGEWLDPVRRRQVAALWFQTLEDGPWEAHADGWQRGEDLYFVSGSRRMGAMGPTLAPFRTRAGAEAFVAEYGGAIRRLGDIDAALLADLRRQGMSQLDADRP